MLFLYLLTQDHNMGYDTYDSCVVVAKDGLAATLIHPRFKGEERMMWLENADYDWTHPDNVKSKLIGVAEHHLNDGDVICASFNAG